MFSDRFMVLASDGVWDVMSNQEVVNFIQQNLITADEMSERDKNAYIAIVCDKLLEQCLERGSVDNMSVIIIILNEGRDQIILQPNHQELSGTVKKLFND
jgi:serine/threonine protein phosphatase PrpC